MPAQKAEYSTLATVSMAGGRPGNPQTPYRCMWFMWAVIILNGLSVTLLAFNSIRTNDKLELLGAQLTQLQVEVHVEADELGLPWLGLDSEEEEGRLDDGDYQVEVDVEDDVDDDEQDEEEDKEQEMMIDVDTSPDASELPQSRTRRNAENNAHDRRNKKSEKKKKTKKDKKNKKGKNKGKLNAKQVKQIKDVIAKELLPVQENIDVTRTDVFYLLNRSQNESSFHVTLPHVGLGKIIINSTATNRTIEWAAADDLRHLQEFKMVENSLYVTVPQTGYYYIYSHITYHGQDRGFSFTGPACEHAVRLTRVSDGQRDDYDLMKSSVTQHNHGRPQALRDTKKYPVDTSVNGGVFILHQGDLLSVTISENTKVCYLTTDPSTTFFGAHRVAGII